CDCPMSIDPNGVSLGLVTALVMVSPPALSAASETSGYPHPHRCESREASRTDTARLPSYRGSSAQTGRRSEEFLTRAAHPPDLRHAGGRRGRLTRRFGHP